MDLLRYWIIIGIMGVARIVYIENFVENNETIDYSVLDYLVLTCLIILGPITWRLKK